LIDWWQLALTVVLVLILREILVYLYGLSLNYWRLFKEFIGRFKYTVDITVDIECDKKNAELFKYPSL